MSVRAIRPPSRWPSLGIAELWGARELVFFLAVRDIKVRYKQTALGVAWALLQPIASAAIFTIFLGRLAGVPSDGMPYALFVLAGLVAWQIFSFAVVEASVSIVANERLVTRVYFPRLAIPVAAVASGLLDFAVSFALLGATLAFYGVAPRWEWVYLPAFVALALGAALGVSLWLSALNVRYRDVRYTLPFLAQVWLFLSPVVYPATLVPERWTFLYALNPMVGVVTGFRWALLGGPAPSSIALAASAAAVAMLLVSGLMYFRRTEQSFADVI
jgi:lipopolysaccharide transport system permease protein